MNDNKHFNYKIALWLALLGAALTALALPSVAQDIKSPAELADSVAVVSIQVVSTDNPDGDDLIVPSPIPNVRVEDTPSEDMEGPAPAPVLEGNPLAVDTIFSIAGAPHTIYGRPASWTYSDPWWHGLWINTAVYAGAFVGTLFVLECLPEDATAWNRQELQKDPFYTRWFNNIFKKGPEWDHDKVIFNFVLHPYAGAAYFMAARTCGFNFWQSLLYSACISTIGWEFGIEACMERPSYQDIFITPLVGSIMGEGFYRLKRLIVNRDYRVLGSPVIGHILAFFLDPVNEVVGLLSPSHSCRTIGPGCIHSQPLLIPSPAGAGGTGFGFTISATI